MTFYIGLLTLFAAAAHLLLLFYDRINRRRVYTETIQLERQKLKRQVAEIVAKSTLEMPPEQAWTGWRKFRVVKVVCENSSVKSFYFVPYDGKPLSPYMPGQHLTFRFKVPGQSKPVTRCYSLSDNANETNYYRISVKKQSAPINKSDVPDGVASSYLHDHLSTGDVVDVRAPSGKFYLDMTEKSPLVLIAGGIGITPSLSMINTLHAIGSERQVWLLYAVQNPQEQIMQPQLATICEAMPNLKIHRFFNHADDADLSFDDRRGFVTCQVMQELGLPFDADFYVCGPPPMMDAIVTGLTNEGINEARIHFESFGPASVSKKALLKNSTHNGSASNDADHLTTHNVSFDVSGKKVDWNKPQGSLLDAAEAAGVEIESGCRAGNCGACSTAILEGEVAYLDEPGVEVERGCCLPCVAIPASTLKLKI